MVRALQLEDRVSEPPEVACPYCGQGATFYPSSELFYGGRNFGPLWACIPCHAWVGCHKGTRTPLGNLADSRTRRLRNEAHRFFDHMWIRRWYELSPHRRNQDLQAVVRGNAYDWLAGKLQLTKAECHIGQFDAARCEEVIKLCKPFYQPQKLGGWVVQWIEKRKLKKDGTSLA